jgi:hypothetical protein
MKDVKLTSFECKVILEALNPAKICNAVCFCDYKADLCNEVKEDGTPRCRLKQAIESIEEKLS